MRVWRTHYYCVDILPIQLIVNSIVSNFFYMVCSRHISKALHLCTNIYAHESNTLKNDILQQLMDALQRFSQENAVKY